MASCGSEDYWFDATAWDDGDCPDLHMPAGVPSVNEPAPLFDLDADQSNAWDSGAWRGGFGSGDAMSPEERKIKASRALADMLIDKYNNGNLRATDVCSLGVHDHAVLWRGHDVVCEWRPEARAARTLRWGA